MHGPKTRKRQDGVLDTLILRPTSYRWEHCRAHRWMGQELTFLFPEASWVYKRGVRFFRAKSRKEKTQQAGGSRPPPSVLST